MKRRRVGCSVRVGEFSSASEAFVAEKLSHAPHHFPWHPHCYGWRVKFKFVTYLSGSYPWAYPAQAPPRRSISLKSENRHLHLYTGNKEQLLAFIDQHPEKWPIFLLVEYSVFYHAIKTRIKNLGKSLLLPYLYYRQARSRWLRT